jgi:all-trans-retinol dehydrogenase (NAD+)
MLRNDNMKNGQFSGILKLFSMKSFYRNKTILITGAGSGIGRKFAEMVSHYGVTLLLWDYQAEELDDFRENLHANTEVLITNIDVTDAESVMREADQVIKSSFVPDIIVNCAGVVVGKYFRDHTPHEIEQTMKINCTGSMLVVNAFLSAMIERGSGQIVNLGSAAGYIGNPKMSVYAASKWAILGWSESLRLELMQQDTGVDVTCVTPGYVKTGMFEGVKAPRLVPLLETDVLVRKMLKGIRRKKYKIQTPFMVRLVPFLKIILPPILFDWLAGRVFRVYHSMDSFKGRAPKSS